MVVHVVDSDSLAPFEFVGFRPLADRLVHLDLRVTWSEYAGETRAEGLAQTGLLDRSALIRWVSTPINQPV